MHVTPVRSVLFFCIASIRPRLRFGLAFVLRKQDYTVSGTVSMASIKYIKQQSTIKL